MKGIGNGMFMMDFPGEKECIYQFCIWPFEFI